MEYAGGWEIFSPLYSCDSTVSVIKLFAHLVSNPRFVARTGLRSYLLLGRALLFTVYCGEESCGNADIPIGSSSRCGTVYLSCTPFLNHSRITLILLAVKSSKSQSPVRMYIW